MKHTDGSTIVLVRYSPQHGQIPTSTPGELTARVYDLTQSACSLRPVSFPCFGPSACHASTERGILLVSSLRNAQPGAEWLLIGPSQIASCASRIGRVFYPKCSWSSSVIGQSGCWDSDQQNWSLEFVCAYDVVRTPYIHTYGPSATTSVQTHLGQYAQGYPRPWRSSTLH